MEILAKSLEKNFWYCLIRLRDNDSFPPAIAREMSAQGLSAQDIGRTLNTNTIQIQHWLSGAKNKHGTKDGQVLQ